MKKKKRKRTQSRSVSPTAAQLFRALSVYECETCQGRLGSQRGEEEQKHPDSFRFGLPHTCPFCKDVCCSKCQCRCRCMDAACTNPDFYDYQSSLDNTCTQCSGWMHSYGSNCGMMLYCDQCENMYCDECRFVTGRFCDICQKTYCEECRYVWPCDVCISLPLVQQCLHHFQMSIVRGPIKWSLTVIICDVCIHPLVQQCLHHFQMSIERGPVKFLSGVLAHSAPKKKCVTLFFFSLSLDSPLKKKKKKYIYIYIYRYIFLAPSPAVGCERLPPCCL